jgi:hypothetical protein
MRKDLIRFGDVLFLDAMRRQYNKWGFPYTSLVMVNEENTSPNVVGVSQAVASVTNHQTDGTNSGRNQFFEPLMSAPGRLIAGQGLVTTHGLLVWIVFTTFKVILLQWALDLREWCPTASNQGSELVQCYAHGPVVWDLALYITIT